MEDRTLPAEKPRKESSPRAQASLRLTEQARVLLENGSPNEAITTFERSVNLNPANGLNYYYMAEAWLSKGQFSKALKFNELAGSYLEESRQWRSKVQVQRKRIHQAMD